MPNCHRAASDRPQIRPFELVRRDAHHSTFSTFDSKIFWRFMVRDHGYLGPAELRINENPCPRRLAMAESRNVLPPTWDSPH